MTNTMRWLVLYTLLTLGLAATVDLTAENRRPPIAGLPDWSQAGYEKGQPLPDSRQISKTITAAQLASQYGVIPNDGLDDTSGLQRAIKENPGRQNEFTLIQLPAGTINLSFTIYLSSNYIILRGAGNDPTTGTAISFTPDENTKYDVITANGANWDVSNMKYSWDYIVPDDDLTVGEKHVRGSASSGWIWPGRSVFRVGTDAIATKFQGAHRLAPPNRKDLFLGTANYHWSNDTGKIKGYMADQTKDVAGFAGTRKIYVDAQNSTWTVGNHGFDVWVAVPARSIDFDDWQVRNQSFYENDFMYQDWFTVTKVDQDADGTFIEVDHDLAWNVYTSSVSGGVDQMNDLTYFTKVMPIRQAAHHIGIEDLYITQPVPGLSAAEAAQNYGNMAPESAMHGIVFRYAKHCWVRNVRTYMTGSHPIATEAARYLQIQDNYFDGSWNKGAGGNGYVRGSRVWDSLYYNNTLRNLRHFTFQWSAMRNVATLQNMTCDLNLHGGYEAYNLLELNYVSIPYSHRAGNCNGRCGGEGGSSEGGTWAPIYWSTGNKASKWSGATGPQNVFFRNYMIKAFSPGGSQEDYLPYFSRDGSLSNTIWQFGWDRKTGFGSRYQHLSLDDGVTLLADWSNNERQSFDAGSGVGVNGQRLDDHTSLFFRDVRNATGLVTYSSIAGYAYCLGKVQPKVIGYYSGSAASRQCLPWNPNAVDASTYTHIIYTYATLASDGTVSLTSAQQDHVRSLLAFKTQFPDFKVFIGVGGWGLGNDATALATIATSNSARTKFGTTASALLNNLNADGIDIEWTPCVGTRCISASQFSTIATQVKTGIGALKMLSLSTPNEFWYLSGVNTITTNLANIVEFISIITHQDVTSGDDHPNDQNVITATVAKAQSAGMPPMKLLFGIPFYSRPMGNANIQSSCIGPNDLGQGTFPFYSLASIMDGSGFESVIPEGEGYLTWYDKTSYALLLRLADGTTIQSETPLTVSARASLSQDLCMGGVAVHSIDQDSDENELTSALFSPGGLSPTHEDIVASFRIQGIDHSGFLRTQDFDRFSMYLATEYPYFTASDNYRLLILAALEIQRQISTRLESLLKDNHFSNDSFELYKTWETKAINYQLTNITGLARGFFRCHYTITDDGNPIPTPCPGSFINSAHMTDNSRVIWTLNDRESFKNYVEEMMGLDLDDLTEGSFKVTRDITSCHHQPTIPCPNCPSPYRASDQPTSDMRRRSRHRRVFSATQTSNEHVKRDDGDPFEPPSNCYTTWSGLWLVNPDTMFANPGDVIRGYMEATDASIDEYSHSIYQQESQAYLVSTLSNLLTSIALGNNTIASMLDYTEQVRWAESMQSSVDQARARTSVWSILADVFLGLISVLPGVGQIPRIATVAKNVFTSMRGLAKLGGAARSLRVDSALYRLATAQSKLGRSLSVREAFSASGAYLTRSRLGSAARFVQDTMSECVLESLGDVVLDTMLDNIPLSSPFLRRTEDAATIAGVIAPVAMSVSTAWLLSDNLTTTLSTRAPRGPKTPPPDCIFQISSADTLKSSNYKDECATATIVMFVPRSLTSPSLDHVYEGSYSDCKKFDLTGNCQCDHLVEPSEVLGLYSSILPSKKPGNKGGDKRLSVDEVELLCDALRSSNTLQTIKGHLNSQNNLAGLYGGNRPGKRLTGANQEKNILLTLSGDGTKLDPDRAWGFEVAAWHMNQFESNRHTVADSVDQSFRDIDAILSHHSDSEVRDAWVKVTQETGIGPNKSPVKDLVEEHEQRVRDSLDNFRKKNDLQVPSFNQRVSIPPTADPSRPAPVQNKGKKRAASTDDPACVGNKKAKTGTS